tara:strand:- start:34389 stop:36320 length:1932 start_codon:yes stop_codon:yes gene_type:complete
MQHIQPQSQITGAAYETSEHTARSAKSRLIRSVACTALALVTISGSAISAVELRPETTGARAALINIEAPEKKPLAQPQKKLQAKPQAKPQPKPKAKPAPQPVKRTAKPVRAQPKPQPKAKPKPQPKPQAKPKPAPRPAAKPAPRPPKKPAAKPAPRPSTKPAARPSTKPTTKPTPKPAVKPTPRPSTKVTPQRPTTRTTLTPRPTNTTKPTPKTTRELINAPRSTPAKPAVESRKNTAARTKARAPKQLVTKLDANGSVPKGVKRTVVTASERADGRSGARPSDTGVLYEQAPAGFDITRVKQAYIEKTRAQTQPVGTEQGAGSNSVDDQLTLNLRTEKHTSEYREHPDPHHDDAHGDRHDGHDGHDRHGDRGRRGHRDRDIDIHIDIDFYSSDSCPSGWWYVYGDYNNDGYTDYVCTNGSYSVYWFGWTGPYWNASPWYGWYGSSHYVGSYAWWWHSVPERYQGPVYGIDAELQSQPSYSQQPIEYETLPDAMPLSALEVARLEMSIGEPALALDAYQAHISAYPDDWAAVREMGIAKIRSGDRGDGIALVSYAYSMDPQLAYDPVPTSLFEDSARLQRDAVIDVVGWGHRNPSASVWLTTAVIMQTEGRDDQALRMIDRATEYGLDPDIRDHMISVLTHR